MTTIADLEDRVAALERHARSLDGWRTGLWAELKALRTQAARVLAILERLRPS